jgi:hypothetical protein
LYITHHNKLLKAHVLESSQSTMADTEANRSAVLNEKMGSENEHVEKVELEQQVTANGTNVCFLSLSSLLVDHQADMYDSAAAIL